MHKIEELEVLLESKKQNVDIKETVTLLKTRADKLRVEYQLLKATINRRPTAADFQESIALQVSSYLKSAVLTSTKPAVDVGNTNTARKKPLLVVSDGEAFDFDSVAVEAHSVSNGNGNESALQVRKTMWCGLLV